MQVLEREHKVVTMTEDMRHQAKVMKRLSTWKHISVVECILQYGKEYREKHPVLIEKK